MTLTGKQKAKLKGQAHGIKPVIQVGKAGAPRMFGVGVEYSLTRNLSLRGNRDEKGLYRMGLSLEWNY